MFPVYSLYLGLLMGMVGGILRSCERSWQRGGGSTGSRLFLIVGCLIIPPSVFGFGLAAILVLFPLLLAMLLVIIGGILRLCELSWEKPAASMGSGGFFRACGWLIYGSGAFLAFMTLLHR